MGKISVQPVYGAFDKTKFLKDLLVIVKNSGTYATPAYASGSTRRVTVEEFQTNFDVVKTVKKSLTAAQIKTLNSVPVVILDYPATGLPAGYLFEPISCFARNNFGTVAFDGALGDLQINSALNEVLLSTGDSFINTGAALDPVKMNFPLLTYLPKLISGGNMYIQASEDSTVGDGTIDVYLSYRIVEL